MQNLSPHPTPSESQTLGCRPGDLNASSSLRTTANRLLTCGLGHHYGRLSSFNYLAFLRSTKPAIG